MQVYFIIGEAFISTMEKLSSFMYVHQTFIYNQHRIYQVHMLAWLLFPTKKKIYENNL